MNQRPARKTSKRNFSSSENVAEAQSQLFLELSVLLASVAAPVRLKLIHFLTQAPLTVDVLAKKVDQSVANTSMHLRKMLQAGVVEVKGLGQKRLYSLHPAISVFWEQVQDLIFQLRPEFTLLKKEIIDWQWTASAEDTMAMAKRKEILLLDVRPNDEVLPDKMQSLKGLHYMHIPNQDIEMRWRELPKKMNIVVICRGRLCSMSTIVVSLLRGFGLNAFRSNNSWSTLMQSGELL